MAENFTMFGSSIGLEPPAHRPGGAIAGSRCDDRHDTFDRTGEMQRVTRVLLAFALFAVAPALFAQGEGSMSGPSMPQQHRLRIGFGGGMEVPTSNAGDFYRNGVTGQGFLLINLGVLPAIRLNLGYSRFDFRNALAGEAQSGNGQILSGVAGMRVNLLPGKVRPYLVAGVGAFNIKNTVNVDGSGPVSQSDTKFGIDGGAGLAFTIGRIDAFVEGRVQNVYTDQGVIDTKSIRTIPVTFGIIF